ncbi:MULTISPECIES: hypothetical protein [Micromonospora]|uniref:Neocarzinostatin family protein n=1 Tax=Micromonospora solifontis TaxID=2487138 RepID=A0ABX9WLZ2_9ACTN|nr:MULTISPECIES: hypothetical protein [Micromonospora]NES15424.1 hypothetical protein [Micromonospora sp. PPF5-17B]NES35830.1 hypothetical protein [Micromonospora solifontis]NES58018.1 hypothetical protein [Micromonospora sp. PPF5-6]RNM00307.1 hypothetical protein EFE23_06575 [Micromonospora solifontis]
MVSVTRRVALLIAAAACAPLLGALPASAGPRPVALPAAEPAPGESRPPPEDVIFVEVTPSTVEPGFLVGIRASCRDNSIPATVVSDAFGRVQVQPQRGLLTASPMVKERTRPGNYRVKLECPTGQTASTMLQVVKQVEPTHGPRPSRGPATGFGGTAGGIGLGGLLVPVGLALTVAGAVVGVATSRRPRAVHGAARR